MSKHGCSESATSTLTKIIKMIVYCNYMTLQHKTCKKNALKEQSLLWLLHRMNTKKRTALPMQSDSCKKNTFEWFF